MKRASKLSLGRWPLARWLLRVMLPVSLSFGPALSPAQSGNAGKVLQDATDTAKSIQDTTGAKTPAQILPTGDPCTVVSAADVKRVFAQSVSAIRSRRLESYGITECAWKGAKGEMLLGIQESIGDSDTRAADEAADMGLGFVDPLKPAMRENLRIERFSGVPVDNAAFVEKADPARGLLSNGAFVALVKGRHLVTLISAELAQRDRAQALQQLEGLAAAAATRLK